MNSPWKTKLRRRLDKAIEVWRCCYPKKRGNFMLAYEVRYGQT